MLSSINCLSSFFPIRATKKELVQGSHTNKLDNFKVMGKFLKHTGYHNGNKKKYKNQIDKFKMKSNKMKKQTHYRKSQNHVTSWVNSIKYLWKNY